MRATLTSPRLWIVTLALALAVAVGAPQADAHRLGGGWFHIPGTVLRLGFTQRGDFRAQVLGAATSWNPLARVEFFEQESWLSPIEINTVSDSGDHFGMAIIHPCSSAGCVYLWVDIQMNSRTLNSVTVGCRQKVAAHELGHALGLAHVAANSTTASIMKQGCQTFNTPRAHDLADVGTMYP